MLVWSDPLILRKLGQLIRRFTSTLTPNDHTISTVNNKIKYLISNGQNLQALSLYKQHLHLLLLCPNNSFILPSIIKASSLLIGLQLHSLVLKLGFNSSPIVSNAFISFYSKLSLPDSARKVFDTMPQRDAISWNSIINCYIQNGCLPQALEMLKQMYVCRFVPKPELIASVVSLCSHAGEARLGKVIHGLVVVDGVVEDSVFLGTCFVDYYFKCGDTLTAFKVFDRMEEKNEVSWTAMVSGCIANSEFGVAFACFREMQVHGFRPNRVSIIVILPACAELGCSNLGKEVHGYVFRGRFDQDHRVLASLIHMYCQCGEALHCARLIFERAGVKDVVMWSSLIGGYARGGDCMQALQLFRQMQEEGVEPNSVTLLAVITACTNMTSLDCGRGVHVYVVKYGFEFDVSIGNALVDMYSKSGCIMSSHQVFREMIVKDSVSWSTLIRGYGLHGCGRVALNLFHDMQKSGMHTDEITILAVLSACNHAGLVEEGRRIFDVVKIDGNISLNGEHYACLIDLLGKSGKIEDAFDVLRSMPMAPNAKALSSLVSACKIHARLETAPGLAHQLIQSEPGNASNYTLSSMILAESGNWVGVEEVRSVMKIHGLHKYDGFSQTIGQK